MLEPVRREQYFRYWHLVVGENKFSRNITKVRKECGERERSCKRKRETEIYIKL